MQAVNEAEGESINCYTCFVGGEMKKFSVIMVCCFLLMASLAGCSRNKGAKGTKGGVTGCKDLQRQSEAEQDVKPHTGGQHMSQAIGTDAGKKGSSEVVKSEAIDEEEKKIQEILGAMTLEEKAGQVFIAAFRRDEQNRPMHVLDNHARQQIEQYHLGGVILFGENIDSISQTQKLIEDMQAAAKIPLFIAVDEEGGRVSRLNSSTKMPATKLPGNKVLGETNDPQLAYEVGVLLGQELSSLGFNMNLAPVADVNTNPRNRVIGDRSFGSDAEKVGEMAGAMVKGMQAQNMSAVLKHFPGHGDTILDTHEETVVLNHDMERLEQLEFLPFIKGIQAGADGVMTAHIQMPGIVEEGVPATFSQEILTGILRNRLHHEQLIITDALEMGAISRHWTAEQAVVRAFNAGADILLMPVSLQEAYQGLLKAVQNGQISEKRLDASVTRILRIKHKRKILERTESSLDPEIILGSEQHQRLVQKIYEKTGQKNGK